MKKILVTLIAIVFIALNAFAQDEMTMKQGHVSYTLIVSGNEQAAQMLNGDTTSYTIKDSMLRIDMKMSMAPTTYIYNVKGQTGVLLMEVMGNKYEITMAPKDVKDDEKNTADYDVKYVDSTKVIAGHICKKALITMKGNGNKTFPAWYDPTLKISAPSKNYYNKVNGLLLQYTLEQSAHGQTLDFVFTCTKLDSNPVDPSTFKIPDGYQQMTMDDFKSAMQGMGGGH